jgi:hypothetical protein
VNSSESLISFDAGAVRLYLEEGREHGPVFDFLLSEFQAAKITLINAGCMVQEENPAIPRCHIRDAYGLVFNIEQSVPG